MTRLAMIAALSVAMLNFWEAETLANDNWLSPFEGRQGLVVLSVFSGQEDPSWSLSPKQTTEFLSRVSSLPVGGATAHPPGLGYRGVSVNVPGDKQEARIAVFSGVVTTKIGDEAINSVDADRTLENWLIDTGRDRLPRDLFDYVSSEAAKPR